MRPGSGSQRLSGSRTVLALRGTSVRSRPDARAREVARTDAQALLRLQNCREGLVRSEVRERHQRLGQTGRALGRLPPVIRFGELILDMR